MQSQSRTGRPPPLGRVRLACEEDAPVVLELVNESMARNFRIENTGDIVYLINNSVISICQLDIHDAIIGFLSCKDSPVLPSLHPKAWEEYIWTKYKTIDLTARNTLFIHLLCWNTLYSRELVDNMLRTLFMHDAYLHNIVMTKSVQACPQLVPGQSRSEGAFRRVQPVERGVPADRLPALCIASRKDVCPRLRIRRAVFYFHTKKKELKLLVHLEELHNIIPATYSEEDNDDIVPIIERLSPRLREMYGEFYISELISRHPESERVLLVCEHNELAVGVMCLNTQINYWALEESYDLSPFAGLRHLHSMSKYKRTLDMETINSSSNMHVPSQLDECGHTKDQKPRVTWLFDEDEFNCTSHAESFMDPTAQSSSMAVLDMLEEDEDELDFDIINIDTNLLRVPKILTYETLGRGLAESIMKVLDDTSKPKDYLDEKFARREKHKGVNLDKAPEPIRYFGGPNAFLLELFAMHPDYDERYGYDMLEAAYELFPDRDYCVMCIPSSHPPFPLLEHFTLVTSFGTRQRFINETLYVAHVNSVKGDVSVRFGEAHDIDCLKEILEHAPRAESLIELFQSALTSSTVWSFVLLSQTQMVGMVILGPLEDATAIRTQYALQPEPRRPRTDGTVLAGVLSPALEPHSRWYLRELLRHSTYTSLFWICRLFSKGDVSPSRNLMSLAGHMTPVLPRQSVPNISGNKDLDNIFQDLATPFALWLVERPLTSLPRVFANTNIVVVGASRTGLAFLEALIMGPSSQYLTFSNITLVSEHGLPTVMECLKAALTCVPQVGCYTDRYLKSVPFHYYVDVISNVMIHIDRKMKCIHLRGGGIKFYDELVLTCGLQFQHPEYLHQPLELVKEIKKGKSCERTLMDDPSYQPDEVPPPPFTPDNVMLINSLFDANNSFKKLLRMINEDKDTPRCLSQDNPVVVYGSCLESYNCLAALLELGLSPRLITFVENFPCDYGMKVNCFNNELVDERVQANIESLGIRVIREVTLAGWRQVDTRVEAVHVMTPLHALRLPCFALFYYGLKAIDIHAFKAINACGLVYDGGLVVGAACDTNDPHVFGAGPCVKYSRRLYADALQQAYYCSEDVGEALAAMFLRKLDPFVMSDDNTGLGNDLPPYNSSVLLWQPVYKFHSPIVQYSVLPGPLYYMKLRKPGSEIPMEVQHYLPRQGHILTTDKRGNYFRLRINALHCIEEVTCLSKKNFSPQILSQLYGKHEAFFHQLLYRYKSDMIEDLYEYFTQPWMAAMYQETFRELLQDINEQEIATVFKMVRTKFQEDQSDTNIASGTCDSEPSCKDLQNLGTFRSMIDKFVSRTNYSSVTLVSRNLDIPSECGQTRALRGSTYGFWAAVGGERLVLAHVARYLARHAGVNLHYARPRGHE